MEMNQAEFEVTLRATLDGYALAKAQLSQLNLLLQQYQKQIEGLQKDLEIADTALKAKGTKNAKRTAKK